MHVKAQGEVHMQIYEIRVNATVSETFRIIAESDEDAATRANKMFMNDVSAQVLNVQYSVQNRNTGIPSGIARHRLP